MVAVVDICMQEHLFCGNRFSKPFDIYLADVSAHFYSLYSFDLADAYLFGTL